MKGIVNKWKGHRGRELEKDFTYFGAKVVANGDSELDVKTRIRKQRVPLHHCKAESGRHDQS